MQRSRIEPLLQEVTLRGRYVTLEPLRIEHSPELYPSAREEEIWEFFSMKVKTQEDLTRWIRKRIDAVKNGTALAFVQRDAKTGQAFGSTSLFEIDLGNRRAEIGHTWIGAGHRRTAANTEAKLLLFTHAFDKLGCIRVQIKTAPENLRSRKAIERLGAKYEGLFRNYMVYDDGTIHDRVIYSVIDKEWPEIRKRLENFLA